MAFMDKFYLLPFVFLLFLERFFLLATLDTSSIGDSVYLPVFSCLVSWSGNAGRMPFSHIFLSIFRIGNKYEKFSEWDVGCMA